MARKWPGERRIDIRCDCHCHRFEVSYWADEEPEERAVFFSWWERAGEQASSRLRWAWDILVRGRGQSVDAVITKDDLAELIAFLHQAQTEMFPNG